MIFLIPQRLRDLLYMSVGIRNFGIFPVPIVMLTIESHWLPPKNSFIIGDECSDVSIFRVQRARSA